MRALSVGADCPDCDTLTRKALWEWRATFPLSVPPEDESKKEEASNEYCSHGPPSGAAQPPHMAIKTNPKAELYEVLKQAATLLDLDWQEVASPGPSQLTIVF